MQGFGRVLRLRDRAEHEYEKLHADVWPSVLEAISKSGISNFTIFRYERWLFSYFELPEGLTLEEACTCFDDSEDCRKWEELMHGLQEPLPESEQNLWWVPMKEVWRFAKE